MSVNDGRALLAKQASARDEASNVGLVSPRPTT